MRLLWLLGMVATFALGCFLGWAVSRCPSQPPTPAPAVEEAIAKGFTPAEAVRAPERGPDVPRGTRTVLRHVAEAPSISAATVLPDCPPPPDRPNAVVAAILPEDLGGACDLEVFEAEGWWYTRANWSGWVNLAPGPPGSPRNVERGPVVASVVQVSEVARAALPAPRSLRFLAGGSLALESPGLEFGAVWKGREKKIGYYGMAERTFGARSDWRAHGGISLGR